jgi:hypothetical protein
VIKKEIQAVKKKMMMMVMTLLRETLWVVSLQNAEDDAEGDAGDAEDDDFDDSKGTDVS